MSFKETRRESAASQEWQSTVTNPGDAPAFPCNPDKNTAYLGMTLRDWHAAWALPAVINTSINSIPRSNESRAEMVGRKAYEFADAMLKARGAK